MKIWKWFIGSHKIAPRPPGHLPHIALTHVPGAHPAASPWVVGALVAGAVLAGTLFMLTGRRTQN